MWRSQAVSVAFVCLLFGAGCLGFFSEERPRDRVEGPSTETSTATESPAGDTTAAAIPPPTAASVGLPPNLSRDRFGSFRQVPKAHNATIWNTSFTIRFSRVRTVNGEVDSRVVGTVRYDGAGTLYSNTSTLVEDESLTRRRTEKWSNGTTAYRAIVNKNETTVEEIPPTTDPPTYADRFRVYFRSFHMSVTGWSRLGETLIVHGSSQGFAALRLTDRLTVDDLSYQLGFEEIERGQFSVDIERTTIQRSRIRLVGSVGNATIVWAEEIRFTRVGATTVTSPEWVSRKNNS